jgi:hypothetical protein
MIDLKRHTNVSRILGGFLELRYSRLEYLPTNVDRVLVGPEGLRHLSVRMDVVTKIAKNVAKLFHIETQQANLVRCIDE